MIASQPASLPLPLPDQPYRGIESFRFVDHPIFCAREREIQKLVRLITIYRGVLLYGASGVGKSSLVNAGLLPEVLAEGFSPERIRLQPRPGEEIIVERIPLTADGEPPFLSSLFAREEKGETRVVLSAQQLPERLRKVRAGVSPLLIFDQFEEFVTLFEEAPLAKDRAAAAEAQKNLLDVLTGLLRDHSFPVKLLFSFREDYLAKLNRLFARYPPVRDQFLRLVPPDKSALREIISGPFKDEDLRRHFGKVQSKEGKEPPEDGKKLPEEAVKELIHEIDEHKQGGPVNLSEVQIACLRLWEVPDPLALLKRRHVQGLLEDFLADALQRLENLREPAVALLSRMVTGRGTRNVISEDNLLQEVAKETRLPEEKLRTVLAELEKTGLVRRERRNETSVYEIVSEFLVPWIRRQKEEQAQNAKFRKDLQKVLIGAGLVLLVLGGALLWRTIVTNRDTEVKKAREERDEAIKQAENLERTVDEYQEKTRKATMESLAARQDLQKLAAETGAASAGILAEAQKESSALKAQFDKEIKDLSSQLTEAETELETLRVQNQSLQRNAENLAGALSACRASQKNEPEPRPGAGTPGTGAQTFGLSGRVTFKETKAPVPKAVLDFSSGNRTARSVTGDDGSYSVSGLLPGSYEVEVTYLGAIFKQKVEVPSGTASFGISLNAVGDSPLNLRVAENIEEDLMPILERFSSEDDLYISKIPPDKLRKAMNSARVPSGERIFAMVDVFTFSPVKRQGILFGQKGLYYFTAAFTSEGPQRGFIPYVDLASRQFGKKKNRNDVSLGNGQFFNVTASSFSMGDLIHLLEEVKGLVSRKLTLALG